MEKAAAGERSSIRQGEPPNIASKTAMTTQTLEMAQCRA